MIKIGKQRAKEQRAAGQLGFPFHGMARESLYTGGNPCRGSGLCRKKLEAERTALCGERYAHLEQRQAVRTGHVPNSLVFRRPAGLIFDARGHVASMVASSVCRVGGLGVHAIRRMNDFRADGAGNL